MGVQVEKKTRTFSTLVISGVGFQVDEYTEPEIGATHVSEQGHAASATATLPNHDRLRIIQVGPRVELKFNASVW